MDISTILQIATPVIMAVTGAGVTMFARHLKNGQDTIKESIQEKHDDLEEKIVSNIKLLSDRVTVVEADTRTFLSKTDLEKRFDHERNGRAALEQAARHLIDKGESELRRGIEANAAQIVALQVGVGKLEQKDEHLTKIVDSLTVRMDEGFKSMDAKLDRLCVMMSNTYPQARLPAPRD